MKSVQHSDFEKSETDCHERILFGFNHHQSFVLSFMGLLTRLSESLNKKQKAGIFLAFALIAGISVMEIVTLAVDGAPAKYRWLNIASNFLGFGLSPAVAICLVYVQDENPHPTESSVCGGLRNCLFVVSCILHPLWNGVFRERGQCIFPGNAFFTFTSRCILRRFFICPWPPS